MKSLWITPPRFNSEFTPEKWLLGRRSSPIGKVTFQGLRAMFNFGGIEE